MQPNPTVFSCSTTGTPAGGLHQGVTAAWQMKGKQHAECENPGLCLS